MAILIMHYRYPVRLQASRMRDMQIWYMQTSFTYFYSGLPLEFTFIVKYMDYTAVCRLNGSYAEVFDLISLKFFLLQSRQSG